MYLNISVEGAQQTCDLQKIFSNCKIINLYGDTYHCLFKKNLGVKILILFIMYLLVTVSYTKT